MTNLSIGGPLSACVAALRDSSYVDLFTGSYPPAPHCRASLLIYMFNMFGFANFAVKDPRLRDHVDRYLSKLQPAHRVGFQNYSNFGLLYPYGGMNAQVRTAILRR